MKWVPVFVVAAASNAFAQVVIYEEHFNDPSAPGWTLSSTYPKPAWAVDSTPAIPPEGGFTISGGNSLNYNDGPNYEVDPDPPSSAFDDYDPNRGTATSPPIFVGAGDSTTSFEFWCYYQTEALGTGTPGAPGPNRPQDANLFDHRLLRIKSGSKVVAAYQLLQIPGGVGDPSVLSNGYVLEGCKEPGKWHRHVLPINPAWGTIQLEFEFATVDGYWNGFAGNTAYSGWFLDDVRIWFGNPFGFTQPGSTGGSAGGGTGAYKHCYVATAAYGNIETPQVVRLADFRDTHIRTNALGELFYATYERVGPHAAPVVRNWAILAAGIRALIGFTALLPLLAIALIVAAVRRI